MTRLSPLRRDLRSPKVIWLKGGLFLVLGVSSAALLWMDAPTVRTALLLGITIWAFCRAYYFAFYVVERYVDPGYRFAGLLSLLRYVYGRKS
jgi:hypothetical protein